MQIYSFANLNQAEGGWFLARLKPMSKLEDVFPWERGMLLF